MKNISLLFLSALFLVSCAGCSAPEKDKQKPTVLDDALLGEWRLIVEGLKYEIAHRNIVFNADGTFYSELVRDDSQRRLHNSGRYWVISDSSIVTLHDIAYQRHASTANVYYVKVDGENMYLKGHYVYAVSSDSIAHTVYVDEHWVRE